MGTARAILGGSSVFGVAAWLFARAISPTGWPPGAGRNDGFLRETFSLPRAEARIAARNFFSRFPKAAYMSEVESWRELPGGDIEFTMRRLRCAD